MQKITQNEAKQLHQLNTTKYLDTYELKKKFGSELELLQLVADHLDKENIPPTETNYVSTLKTRCYLHNKYMFIVSDWNTEKDHETINICCYQII